MATKEKKSKVQIDADTYYTTEQVKTFLGYTHRQGVVYLITSGKIPTKFVEINTTTPFYKKYKIKGEAVLQLIASKK